MKSLEDTLDVTLIVRSAQSSNLTPEGARLAEGLTAACNLINASIEQLKPEPLTLSCSASIMMYWLLPRIGGFHQRYPQTELQFNMNYDQIDFARDKISVAIRASAIAPPKNALTRASARSARPRMLQANGLHAPGDLAGDAAVHAHAARSVVRLVQREGHRRGRGNGDRHLRSFLSTLSTDSGRRVRTGHRARTARCW